MPKREPGVSTPMTFSHGDYTELAKAYAAYRPGYAPELASTLVGMAAGDPQREVDFVDVGAGTGIWTRMLAGSCARTTAIEPNEAMRFEGASTTFDATIEWRRGTAEATGLAARSCDLLTMASSFHWVEFERATAEFARLLRPGGVFAALWNTRAIEDSPLLAQIEAELQRAVPHLERVSSGRSSFCEGLSERLRGCGRFVDVVYLEGRHVERMTPERYLGIWRSVNDVRVQAGEAVFARFLDYVVSATRHLDFIDALYVTRAWVARVPGADAAAE